ncbi:MAG: NlpC/P60 family protein [Mycobacterium sp.]|nr:NlpC/P60 family protein [Mycobacterium sp.]
MARLRRFVSWAATVLAVPATVAFAPVHPGASVRWEPQVVTVAHQVQRAPSARAAALPGRGSAAGAIAVRAALTRLGDPYVWAAAGPHAFDCSGLVVWSFRQAGVELPHSSQALARGGQPVSLNQIRPGDVITYYSDASHVGLYVGAGKMVHASTYGVPVAVVPLDNAPIYNIRRYQR